MFSKILFASLLIFSMVQLRECQPKISDDFFANAVIIEQKGTHQLKYEGQMWEDYTNKRQRIDAEHAFAPHMELLRLFDVKKEYTIQNGECNQAQLNRTMRPTFGWVDRSTQGKGPCFSKIKQGVTGILWNKIEGDRNMTLCVNKADAREPLYVEVRVADKSEDRMIMFKDFKDGTPSADVFSVPGNCN